MLVEPVKVLFVCMGNICRSPAAEGVFRHYVRQLGHEDRISIDSAGTIGFHTGSPADSRMQAAAKKRGYRLESRARQVSVDDISAFDLIVAMDHDNLRYLKAITGDDTGHIHLLGSFLPECSPNDVIPAVPDPYYGGNDGFERVLDMIESACPGLLQECLTPGDHHPG